MPCHIVSFWPVALCGVDFSKLEEPHPHSYVESLSRRLEMADCSDCLRDHHRSALERLGDEEDASDLDADRTVEFLNELVAIDRTAMAALVETRVPCNPELADHPHVQVRARDGKGDGVPDSYVVGLMGVLNGLLRAEEDGFGRICAVYGDAGELERFARTPPRAPSHGKTFPLPKMEGAEG